MLVNFICRIQTPSGYVASVSLLWVFHFVIPIFIFYLSPNNGMFNVEIYTLCGIL